jgi:hypothetical protein
VEKIMKQTWESLSDIERKIDDLATTVNKSNFSEGLSAAVDKVTSSAFKLIQADPHQWSTRDCQTCRLVSELIKKPFGCVLYAKEKAGR